MTSLMIQHNKKKWLLLLLSLFIKTMFTVDDIDSDVEEDVPFCSTAVGAGGEEDPLFFLPGSENESAGDGIHRGFWI